MTATHADPGALHYLPLANLKPWDDNPRPRARRHAETDAELVASIKANGVVSSLVVRPNGAGGQYLIVCGERRYHAAKAAGLETVPVAVRTLTDAQALEIALTENIARSDMHPLDEAAAFAKLRTLDTVYTVEALAARFGKPVSFVKRRLALLNLDPAIRDAFMADVITAGHAEPLAKLPKAEQVIAFEHGGFINLMPQQVAKHLKAKDWDALRGDVASLGAFRKWIETNVKLEVKDPEVQERFPEIADVVKAAAAPDAKPYVEVSRAWYLRDDQRKALGGVLPEQDYKTLKKADACAHAEKAIVVHGGRPDVLVICRTKTCKTHFAPSPRPSYSSAPTTTPKQRKAEKAKAEKKNQERETWDALFAAAQPVMVPILKRIAITPAIVKEITFNSAEVTKRFGLKLTPDTAVACLVADFMCDQVFNRKSLATWAKRIGWNFPAFEKQWHKNQAAALKAKAAKRGRA